MSAAERRVLIASNRLPVTARWEANSVSLQRSVGGLATAMRPIHERSGGLWFGTSGDDKPRPRTSGAISAELDTMGCVPVNISPADYAVYYEQVSNGIIWPLFHDRVDRLPFTLEGWDVYERANARFADAIAASWQRDDLIWIHDYHLLRLPALLRERLPDARIGFFLHIPFPNPEMFLTLPYRRELVAGLLGADVVGFHTRRYRGHFTAAVRRLLGHEMEADGRVTHEKGTSWLGVFPIGIDAAEFSAQAMHSAVTERMLEIKSSGQALLLGVDRLDYTKGILRKLLAFERLLADFPDHRERVRLLQLAVPSREGVEAYQSFRRDVEMLVTRINGRFGTAAWTPIQYLHQSVDRSELLALYRAADLMLVTPLRDGMNLVAKEFVAARNDESGVLLLSEFAGAVDELPDALIVNPYDVAGAAVAMDRGLRMEPEERRQRMRALRGVVFRKNVHVWANEFLDSLANAHLVEPSSRSSSRSAAS
jgi:trehalose 6-phosphate synthase/phosphatase